MPADISHLCHSLISHLSLVAHAHTRLSLHGQGHPRPQWSQKHCPAPLAHRISSELPSTTSSTFKSSRRKSDLFPLRNPALSKTKSSPASKRCLDICREHPELQALNTTNPPAGRDPGPLGLWAKQLSTGQDQAILPQSSGDP